MSERKFPPFTEVGMFSLALIVIGGIYLSAHIPQHVPLGLPTALLIASALLVVFNLCSLTRVPDFAWGRFFQVGKWALARLPVDRGADRVRVPAATTSGAARWSSSPLSLLVYAVQVPAMIGFTVARYDTPGGVGADGSLAHG